MNSFPDPDGLTQDLATRTLLLVEDHAAVRASLRDWLKAHFPGYAVLEAVSGEAAVTLATERPLTLAVIDIGLPGMTGFEVTRRLKQLQPQALVVIISIHDAPAYRADALAAGARAFVPKYNLHADLGQVLRSLLT